MIPTAATAWPAASWPEPQKTISAEQRLASASAEAVLMTDPALAKGVMTAFDEHMRRAYLRELMWRHREVRESGRPWENDPEYRAWWEI